MTAETTTPTPVLVVGAHPDDPEFGCGGSIARWVGEGRPVTYVVMTRGDKGTHDPEMTAERLMALREVEQRAAAAALGVTDVRFLDCRDGEVVASLAVREQLVRVIREVKPGTVVTHDPTLILPREGFVNHPDHRATGTAVIDACFPASELFLAFPDYTASTGWLDRRFAQYALVLSLVAPLGDVGAARAEMLRQWPKTESSSFMQVIYYEWFVRYLRIVCDLACAWSEPHRSTEVLHDARNELKRLMKLDQPTFLVYANALKLVMDAAGGQVPAPQHWQSVLQTARQHKLGLLVVAIQWHAERWHPTGAPGAARGQLLEEGCVNPERLMNLILPLPHAQI